MRQVIVPGTKLPPSVIAPYTGGHTVIHGGYVWELCPDHPRANPFGFVPQHRLVVERRQGVYLSPGIQVHHEDEDKQNNDPGNLTAMTRSEHMRLHRKRVRERHLEPMTRELVRLRLAGGGIKAAARALGCHTETIRNRYPDLLEPYKRRAPTKIDDPVAIAKILAVAPNDKKGYREVAAETGISFRTVQRICLKNGIPWVSKYAKRPGRPRKIRSGDRLGAP